MPVHPPFLRKPSASNLPEGVSLVEIDGGPTFYGDNGLTLAANAGWDDPDFIPIAMFLEKFRNSTDAARWNELGCNTAWAVQGDVSNTAMQNNGTFLVVQSEEWLEDHSNNLYQMTLGSNCVGISCADEPSLYTQISSPIANFPNASQDGRLWYVNYTNTAMRFYDLDGHDLDDLHNDEFPTPNATTRHLNLVGMDHYYFAGSFDNAVPSEAGGVWNLGRSMTADELQRGARYIDVLRFMRLGSSPTGGGAWQPTYPAPMSVYVETGSPYDDNNTEAEVMRAAWLPSAVWGTIIGGARYLKYFTLGDAGAVEPGGIVGNDHWDTPYNGESVSIAEQMAATNALVTTLAPVINSPFATGYATVSPAPVMITTGNADSGIDFMVKYHNRGTGANNKFYIFATPRYGNRTHNTSGVDTGAESWPKTATFTIANTGSTQVTVINESRTISVTGAGTTFQDSFAGPHTVHIYRVD